MIKRLLKFMQYYGILSSFGLSLFLGYLYLVAYLRPDKMVIMDINHYREAWWEVWVVAFMLFCACVAIAVQVWNWREARLRRKSLALVVRSALEGAGRDLHDHS